MAADIQGDRALPKDGVDQLGFNPMAERLAEALMSGSPKSGLVVGVLGRWGSGKSSFLNLTQAAVEARDSVKRPHIVEFKPWLVRDRDALLQALFGELASGIDQIEHEAGDATGRSIAAAKNVGDSVREFAASLGGVAKVTKAAGVVVPWLGTIGGFVGSVADAASKKKASSLAVQKGKVSARLLKLPRSLIVLIDDVDRLEPGEIVEVLRLVRSVADFPNVTYVLSYDVDKVAHAVEVAAMVDDGHAYVEKIVQITVPVPIPEAFELRRWFERELKVLVHSMTPEEDRRISEIVDQEGGRYLVSPRAVVRTLDSIRFYWAALQGMVDFSDFVWLQFVKVGNPALYDWIAIYLTEMAARTSGRVHMSDEDILAARAKLDEALQREGRTFDRLSDRLSEFLPGIDIHLIGNENRPGVYERVDRTSIERAVRQRRLASPDHYRLYLSFAVPANTPTHADYTALTETLENSAEDAAGLLSAWQEKRLTSGVSKTEVMLDRLANEGLVEFNPVMARNLLLAFSDVMDVLGRGSINDFGGPDVWRRAARALPRLLQVVEDQRPEVISEMFRDGRAMGWLSSVFRDETFAHGRYGDRPSSDRLLTSEELDLVGGMLTDRYRGMTFADFASLPQPLSALFAWQQGGDENGPRQLLAREVETVEGLLFVLESMGGMSRVATPLNVQERITLSRSNIAPLLDYDAARRRIENLASDLSLAAELRSRASSILESFENGDRF